MRDYNPIISGVKGKQIASLKIGVNYDEPYLTPDALEVSDWSRAQVRTTCIVDSQEIWSNSQDANCGDSQPCNGARITPYLVRDNEASVGYIEELSGEGMFTGIVFGELSNSLEDEGI